MNIICKVVERMNKMGKNEWKWWASNCILCRFDLELIVYRVCLSEGLLSLRFIKNGGLDCGLE